MTSTWSQDFSKTFTSFRAPGRALQTLGACPTPFPSAVSPDRGLLPSYHFVLGRFPLNLIRWAQTLRTFPPPQFCQLPRIGFSDIVRRHGTKTWWAWVQWFRRQAPWLPVVASQDCQGCSSHRTFQSDETGAQWDSPLGP